MPSEMMTALLQDMLKKNNELHEQEARAINDKCKASLEITARSALARLDPNNPPAVSSDELIRLVLGEEDEDDTPGEEGSDAHDDSES